MTDNFKKIEELLLNMEVWFSHNKSSFDIDNPAKTFDEDKDSFYAVKIIQRKKDLQGLEKKRPLKLNKDHCLKYFYINKISDLSELSEEIKDICNFYNARAYICVNIKSYEQITKNVAVEYVNRITSSNYDKPQYIFDSCVSKYQNGKRKIWIVDIDKEDSEKYNKPILLLKLIYQTCLAMCRPRNETWIGTIETKTGVHLITRPFDRCEFNKQLVENGLDPNTKEHNIIKENDMTLLYENI